MSNQVAILDKIERNMKQRGYAADTVRSGSLTLEVDGMIISYTPKAGDQPHIGVSGSTSPFLGIDSPVAGSLKIRGAAGENTLATILTNAVRVTAVSVMSAFANDLEIQEGDTTTILVRIAGHADVLGLGE